MKRVILLLAFVASPLSGQIVFGDTSYIHEKRETRGFFYLDTTETVDWMRAVPGKPWVERINPPLDYWDWWRETSECQNVFVSYADFRKLRFFLVNRTVFGMQGPATRGYFGYFVADSMAIYLVRKHKMSKALVMHEMTHVIMHKLGEPPGHPFHRFGPFGCGFRYKT